MTSQRRVIAQVLDGDHVHLTAEEVFTRARAQLPEISLATVYNTLNELVAIGEVQQVDAGGPTRYDPNTTHRHHHLVCLQCGALHDVFPLGEGQIRLPRSQRFGHRIINHEILFQGYCARCDGRDPEGALGTQS